MQTMKKYMQPQTQEVNLTVQSVLQTTSPGGTGLPIPPSYPGAPARESYTPRQEPGK